MRKSLKTGAAVLMLTCLAGNVSAATANGCARPEDLSAVKAAAVQQRLMVAALSCDAIQLYNKFVTSYQKELQASDRTLENFFRRLNGRTGTEDFHAFKTRLANASSMQSIGDITGYCASAKEVFAVALDGVKTSLTNFVSLQKTSADDAFAPCQFRSAEAEGIAPLPEEAPVPHFKPGTIVNWPQNAGVTASK
jgi:hypothetical protein